MPAPLKLFVEQGQRFGRGVVIDPEIRTGRPNRRRESVRGARLKCDCGNAYETAVSTLLRGQSQSCGCLNRETLRRHSIEQIAGLVARTTTHGLTRHPLYKTWWNALERCHNPLSPNWKNYGSRGIAVCPEWHDVAAFIGWIGANLGPRPQGCTLDRIDGDGDYEPGNVQWATVAQQNAKRRAWGRQPTDLEIPLDVLAPAAARAAAEGRSLAEVATGLLRSYGEGWVRPDLRRRRKVRAVAVPDE